MADATFKTSSGDDLILSNDDGSKKIEVPDSGDVEVTGDFKTTTVKATNLKANDGTTALSIADSSGNVSLNDKNITNVGDISLDTISSDAGTSVGVTLGTDAGDDFNVGSGKLVVEGDSGNVGINTDSPGALLHVYNNASGVNNYINISSNTNAQSGIQLQADTTRQWEIANGADDILRILDRDISEGVSLAQNSTSWAGASDERQKTDWENFENALDKINTLTKIGTYKSIDPLTKEYIKKDTFKVGVSGQEVEKILPEAINKMKRHPGFKDNTLYIQLEYQALFVLALKAIQELSAKVIALEEQNKPK